MQVAVDQTLGAQDFGRRPDRQHFGVGGRVLQFQRAVARPGNDIAGLVGHHGADGHLPPQGGGFGLFKGVFKGGWQIQSHRAN